LSIERTGEADIQIIAKVNPTAKLNQAYMPRGQELRRIIYEVSQQILDHDDVKTAAAQMQTAGAGTKEKPHQISGGTGFPAAVRHYQQTGGTIPQGQSATRHYEIGSKRLHVSEDLKDDPNAFVRGAYDYLPGKDGKPDIKSEMQVIMQETNLDDRQLAGAIRRLIQTGEFPEGIRKRGQAEKLGRFTYLMFGREAVRNKGMVAMSPMMLSLIAQGEKNWDWEKALKKFPMSMKNAQPSAKGLEAEARGEKPVSGKHGTKASRRLLARREMALVHSPQ
jgi:hypothetical protein